MEASASELKAGGGYSHEHVNKIQIDVFWVVTCSVVVR
jgi:hypothetical protein